MRVNPDRLQADLERLSEFGRDSAGGVSRPALSEADVAARRWFAQRAQEAGLQSTLDPLLNVVVGLGSDAEPAVWTGSHLDSVPNGGRFDGAVGAIAGLECLRRVREEGLSLSRPLRAVAFQDEEGAFRGYLGSTALVSGYTDDELRTIAGRDGHLLSEALDRARPAGQAATAGRLGPRSVHSFVELHVEQGPVLEATNTQIGVVAHIVGIVRASVTFYGRPDHAGTTPMHSRRDALRGAAAFLDRLPEIPARCGLPDAVATCGRLVVEPGVENVVPGTAIAHLDFRAGSRDDIERLEAAIEREAGACGARCGLEVAYRRLSSSAPVQTDPHVRGAIEGAADELGLTTRLLPSGAGHDAQIMAALGPIGMIFVPSRDGRSHSPLEYTSSEAVENGANVLLATLIQLAGGGGAVV